MTIDRITEILKLNLTLSSVPIRVSEHKQLLEVITNLNKYYIKVNWPESQELMDKDWFEEEAILVPNEPSCFMIPLSHLV